MRCIVQGTQVLGFGFSSVESSRATPPHRSREDWLAYPADTSRSNLAAAAGSAFEVAFQTLPLVSLHGELRVACYV